MMTGESVLLALLIQSATASATDTLVYREVIDGRVEVAAPQGPLVMETFHEAEIAYVRLTPDSAHAWYEALELGVAGPQSELRPPTEGALRKEFILRLDEQGRVETLAAPVFPESFKDVSDLTRQFYDFFMPGPGKPLTLGLSWTDSFMAVDTVGDRVTDYQKRGRYRVVGDSVVGGQPVWIVSADLDHEIRTEGPGPQPGVTAISILEGSDAGEFIIRKDRGDMVARRRTGILSGELRYEGLPQTVVLPQTLEYTNSIELLPRRDPDRDRSGGAGAHDGRSAPRSLARGAGQTAAAARREARAATWTRYTPADSREHDARGEGRAE